MDLGMGEAGIDLLATSCLTIPPSFPQTCRTALFADTS